MDVKRIELRQDGKSKQWLPYVEGVMMDGVVAVEIGIRATVITSLFG
jgi:hypothetical protein